jgi:ubiquitin-protein ligase E3 C
MPLVTFPFTSSLESSPNTYVRCLEGVVSSILSIPLLPNRLPFSTLSDLSARLPFSSLNFLLPSIPDLAGALSLEARIHLIANLLAFVPPRYSVLPAASYDSYLRLLAALLNLIPKNALDPPESGDSHDTKAMDLANDSDSDSDSNSPSTVVRSFTSNDVLPPLDPRTRKRLQTLPSVTHLNSLLSAGQNHSNVLEGLVSLFFALNSSWPSRRSRVLGTVVVFTGGGLVRELYRTSIRSSPLGSHEDPVNLFSMLFPTTALGVI